MKTVIKLLIFSTIFLLVKCTTDTKITRARLESCPGCQLNRLTEVKKFVYEDVPKYENVEFKKITGAPPVLIFLNEVDEIVEQFPLKNLNRQECNELLQKRGFVQKSNEKDL